MACDCCKRTHADNAPPCKPRAGLTPVIIDRLDLLRSLNLPNRGWLIIISLTLLPHVRFERVGVVSPSYVQVISFVSVRCSPPDSCMGCVLWYLKGLVGGNVNIWKDLGSKNPSASKVC
jgi:hypothetical protein